jgi:undecaprenyl-diphosphatase
MMRWLTHLGGARVTIGVGALTLALGETRLGLAMLAANLLAHLPVQLLKRLVARPRPADALGRPLALVPLPDPFSFPSGHAAAATAVAAPALFAHPSLAPALIPLVALVGYSRVALRVHHATDMVAGAALGLGAAILAMQLL